METVIHRQIGKTVMIGTKTRIRFIKFLKNLTLAIRELIKRLRDIWIVDRHFLPICSRVVVLLPSSIESEHQFALRIPEQSSLIAHWITSTEWLKSFLSLGKRLFASF